ncbi:Histone deacetylase 6 [Hondaea fermentalgiana]|uniref:Histone deacetylase 6 n=1 Tax=Hondaea fermentalgiana TaxID=2315210 RepID=A0A2R5G1Y0_9STRA|nr:Histone deacetylase 6 [Hondaea fermentalgiana]|eukprot:GBG24545.1 Histone deacetylase 6 [Hondaea fermentalgiana]
MMSSKSSSSTSSSSFIASAKEDGESAAHRVGVAYCESFALHASPRKGHEERPARLDAIVRKLHSLGLWERASRIPVRDASDDELMSIHTKGYVRKLARIERQCKDATSAEDKDAVSALCEKFTLDHEDVYLNGHSGFCIFNNVALAAKHAVDTLGLARVLVVDWDVHHGNGTQHAFYKDPRVMYFSVHRFDFGRYYPSLESAGPMSVGCGLAAGTNVNVAWNGHGIGDAEYLMAWENVLMPIAREFRPEMVIVSAGFDAAEGDRMGRCKVSPQGFAAMTRELQSLAQGRMLLVLEGGYELSSLSDSFAACAHELFGCTSEQDHEARVSRIRSSFARPEAVKAVEASVRAQKPYWSSLASVGRTLS